MKIRDIFTIFMISLTSSSLALAQPQPRPNQQSGDLQIEEVTGPKAPTYALNQAAALEWLAAVKSSAEQGGLTQIPIINNGAVQHLAIGYLYCVSKLGTCEFILSTVLEADVIDGRGKNENKCENMTQFWKAWLEGDFERRLSYLAPVGSSAQISTFNKTIRPRYVKCRDTVGQILAQTKDDAAWAARYSKDGALNKDITKANQVFQDAKTKNLDLMAATGLSSADTAQEKDSGSGKRKTK